MHKIYIPTYKRVEDQITFDSLPDKYKEKTILVVQEHERPLHKHKVEYLVVEDGIGIAKTRKEIIYHAGKSRFCIYDDDVKFYRRNKKYIMKENWLDSDMKGVKRPMTEDDFDEMFDIFNFWMDNQNIIQIGHRSAMLPPSWHLYTDFTDVYSGYMINGVELSKFVDEIDWEYVKVGEDSMMSLEFLLRGYKIRRSELFCIQPKWWQEGGCSEFRNAKLHNEEHKKLMDKYPEYVYVKYEIERPNIGKIMDYRYRWKDAYRSHYTKQIRKCDSILESLPYHEHIG
tara:strand:- start:54 stop:908 length:855 start_codon:yes stop_codon:yes gene_type:complete